MNCHCSISQVCSIFLAALAALTTPTTHTIGVLKQAIRWSKRQHVFAEVYGSNRIWVNSICGIAWLA
ncbi:hypothetical protein EDD18DRAFT_1358185 [Armillaria luteobubalina]|uniref:Secreted protein n=1 Tax=Armillaria luteobubalina TaxID=153913 RepID=A0AA39PZS8_9AGAR|nr:hypothetical protein EDD18DRAFT_1358185 [Armillaria luteobubalina]